MNATKKQHKKHWKKTKTVRFELTVRSSLRFVSKISENGDKSTESSETDANAAFKLFSAIWRQERNAEKLNLKVKTEKKNE